MHDLVGGAAVGVAALLAGVANSAAGGGSLITFPVLVATGSSPLAANVTNSVALVPGLTAAAAGARPELEGQSHRVRLLAWPTLAGAVAGVAILLAGPQSAFEAVVPLCILAGTAAVAALPRLRALAAVRSRGSTSKSVPAALYPATFTLGVYAVYFGAGYGIMMLPVLSSFLNEGMARSNALRLVLSLTATAVTLVGFGFFGPVNWQLAAVMSVGQAAGGYSGASLVRRLDEAWIRTAIVAFGTASAIAMALR